MCYGVLGQAEGGEYLRSAREAVEHATTALVSGILNFCEMEPECFTKELEPGNITVQPTLEEAKQGLKNAEEDAKEQLLVVPDQLEECEKTEAEAEKLATDLATRHLPRCPKNPRASLPSRSHRCRAMSTRQVAPSTMFSPLSAAQGLLGQPEDGGDPADHHNEGW